MLNPTEASLKFLISLSVEVCQQLISICLHLFPVFRIYPDSLPYLLAPPSE